MIKTDGVQRSLVGEITKRFEQASLKLVGMKMFVPDRERATKHYGKDDEWCEQFQHEAPLARCYVRQP